MRKKWGHSLPADEPGSSNVCSNSASCRSRKNTNAYVSSFLLSKKKRNSLPQCPSCPDPQTCARLLDEKWRQAYQAVFRFGPCQPSMVFRYLRTLEGVSPPLALSHLVCQTTAKAFVATRAYFILFSPRNLMELVKKKCSIVCFRSACEDLAQTRRHLARVLQRLPVWLARRSLAATSCIARSGRRTQFRRGDNGIIIVTIATQCRDSKGLLVE